MTSPTIRALVAEDEISWQQILTEILTDSGLVVDVTSNVEEAIKILKSEPHRLAIIDLSLAGDDHRNYDGLRILEGVRNIDPGCQTILLTGYATVELAVSVLTEYGAFTFLRKENFHRTQFKDILNRALASSRSIGSKDTTNVDKLEREDSTLTTSEDKLTNEPVLVVEDDAGWRSIIYELLIDLNYHPTICASYGEALGYLRREKYALAVIDLSLTVNSTWNSGNTTHPLEGYDLLTTTKSLRIPTIVVSGIASVDEIRRAYSEQSIYAYLEKQSFDRNTFRRLVNEAYKTRLSNSELDCLTDREREVYDLLAKGLTNKEIAEALVITTNTVKRHLKSIFEKLGVHTRSAATSKSFTRFQSS
jgi:DNA-binding NarL/FixJ family response regulator